MISILPAFTVVSASTVLGSNHRFMLDCSAGD